MSAGVSDTLVLADLGAVILAGGLARRMAGQDKGLIELAGQPMIQYALNTIRPLVGSCVINANRHLDQYRRFGLPVIQDQMAGHLGPLAGLSAGIDALESTHVMMCPCDSPFLQAELYSLLHTNCIEQDADVAVAHDGDRLQPVFCVVHRRVKEELDRFLESGERKIDRWFERQSLVKVPSARFVESFRNINTEDELIEAQKVLMT